MIRFNTILFPKQSQSIVPEKSPKKENRKKKHSEALFSQSVSWDHSLLNQKDSQSTESLKSAKLPPQSRTEDRFVVSNEPTVKISGLENQWFWLRPLLIESGLALFLVWFYYEKMIASPIFPDTEFYRQMFIQFSVQTFLIVFMLIASMIDFDDYIIPDSVVIPGTVLGILLMTFFYVAELNFNFYFDSQHIPQFSKDSVSGSFLCETKTFGILAACWTLWAFALLDRRWYSKLSLKKRFYLFGRSLKRSILTPILFILWILGIGFIYYICSRCWNLVEVWNDRVVSTSVDIAPETIQLLMQSFQRDFLRQNAIYHSITGLTVGMLLIWSVRLLGKKILQREAMGFGDVTLLGMIGVFVGWRGAVIVFFLAPLAGLVFGLIRLLFRTEKEIPYGPFLCLATLVVLTESSLLQFTKPLFSDSETLLIITGLALVLFVILLLMIQGIKRLIFR